MISAYSACCLYAQLTPLLASAHVQPADIAGRLLDRLTVKVSWREAAGTSKLIRLLENDSVAVWQIVTVTGTIRYRLVPKLHTPAVQLFRFAANVSIAMSETFILRDRFAAIVS